MVRLKYKEYLELVQNMQLTESRRNLTRLKVLAVAELNEIEQGKAQNLVISAAQPLTEGNVKKDTNKHTANVNPDKPPTGLKYTK